MNSEVVNSEWDDAELFGNCAQVGFSETDQPIIIASYRDLKVWKLGMSLARGVYQATGEFPREELYGLVSQMRRASVSIPANIAEGYGRETTGALIQFLRISQGSLKELETLVELSHDLGFLGANWRSDFQNQTTQLGKMLRGFIKSLEQRRRQ